MKHENQTPTGSFKVRGALVHLARLYAMGGGAKGIVTATRGNHGISLAFAAKEHGWQAVVVMPRPSSSEKAALVRALGAELVEHGDDLEAAREHACALANQRSLHFVPSYHPDLVLGAATLAAELFDVAGELDAIYVPVGTGCGISGVILARDLLGATTEVIGVAAANAPAMARSVAKGRVVTSGEVATFLDGVACRVPDADAVAAIRSGAARVLLVSEEEVAYALRLLYRTTHNLAEPAGAVALAGVLQDGSDTRQQVGVVLSGGNGDSDVLAEVLAGRTPRPVTRGSS